MTDRRALVVVAHADDETLGCGATIARLAGSGWTVRVVILSDGQITTREEPPADQTADAARACAVLGVEPPVFLGFPDQRLDQVAVAELAAATARVAGEPDLILTTSDSDLNRDHRIACEVAKIVGRPRPRPVSILAGEVPGAAAWNGRPFPAQLYVEVADTLARKVEAFSCYASEQGRAGAWSADGIELLSRYHGLQSGLQRAEAFQVIRAVAGQLP